MKVLIWMGCFFLYALIQVFLGYGGLRLSPIELSIGFAITFAMAKWLSRKWDNYKNNRRKD